MSDLPISDSPVYGATGGPPSAVPCLTARGGGIVPGGEQIYAKRSTAAHQPADRRHELGGLLGLVVLPGAHDTVARVVVEEAERDLVQRGLHRGDLREHV